MKLNVVNLIKEYTLFIVHCQTCQFLPKQYTAITKCHHILSKNVFKEVLLSHIQSMVKQQEFNMLAMPCYLYVGQEFARLHVGIKLTWTMVLDLVDNLFKHLGFSRYLDASDLPNQIVLEGLNCSITKLNLHEGEAITGSTIFARSF